jgi:hypothetical protein
MKKALLAVTLVTSLFILQSCDKNEHTEESHPITGLWIGTYDITQAAESGHSFYYSYFLRNDDTIQVQGVGADGNTYYAIGTWDLEDSVFHATFATTNLGQTGVQQNATAIYDKKNGVLRNGVVESVDQYFKASFKLERTD